MKVEIEVGADLIHELAIQKLKASGLNPDEFKMMHNHAAHSGSRGDGNLSRVRYTFEGDNE